jgi:signal transduction histidine kinase
MNSSLLSSSLSFRQSLWLNLALLFQVGVICLTIGLFIISIPINYERLSIACKTESCAPGELAPESVEALNDAGMSLDTLIKFTIALDILVAVIYTASAILIFIRKPNDLLTIFVTIMLVTFGVATFANEIQGLAAVYPQWSWLTKTIEMIGNCAIVAFFFVFPAGRFVPRRSEFILAGWIMFQLPRYYFPDSSLNLLRSNPGLYDALFVGGLVTGLVAQIYRYWRVSNSIERLQTKWVVFGIAIGVGGFIITRLLTMLLSDPNGHDLLINLALFALSTLFMLLLPISISIAVLRYRLWDINPIINRTLVYGALSASTIAFYIFAVGFFSNYFQQSKANFILSFLATGVIAFLFEPLREDLQRLVNRLMYGERDDPSTVLIRLSQRLDSALAPDSVLPTIVETVAQTLRLPYTAITLHLLDQEPRIVASAGSPQTELIHLPLNYQTERVGELLLAPRAAGESFSAADMKLLNIIAQQAGLAAHTVRLTEELQQLNTDLQQSRERLVTAQEEERRRLRRDLHDGVGPTLASLSQRLDTVADLVGRDPEASVQLLKELKGQVKRTVAEIRRLVYALRPPVLDEFGLVSAIREHVASYMGPNGLQITFDVTEAMPPLPAAVEVAAYRIVLEAFTNVIRHAEASQCTIKIKLDGNSLLLEVSDDGKGLLTKTHSGIGFTSMQERASELGGEYVIENISAGGTRISARLPIVGSAHSLASNGLPLEASSQVLGSEVKD